MNGKTPPKELCSNYGKTGSDVFPIILVLFTGYPSSPYFCVFY